MPLTSAASGQERPLMSRNRATKATRAAGGRAQRESGTGRFRVSPARVDKLRDAGFSADELYGIVAPRRTLSRRKERNETLTPTESDRVIRLERISELAESVFGSRDKAQRWLRSEIVALDGLKPIELLQSETGARIVEDELIRIDFGMLA